MRLPSLLGNAHSPLWVSAQAVLGDIISLFVFAVIARLIGPANFGLVSLALVFLLFVDIFVEGSVAQWVVYNQAADSAALSSAFVLNVVVGLAVSLISFTFFDVIGDLFGSREVGEVIRWLAGISLLKAICVVPEAVLLMRFKFRCIAGIRLFSQLMGALCGIVLAIGGLGYWALIAQQLTIGFVSALGFIVFSEGIRLRSARISTMNRIVGFCWPLILVNIQNFFRSRFDRYLLGLVHGTYALGAYSAAHRFCDSIGAMLGQAVAKATMPGFARLREQSERLQEYFLDSMHWTCTTSFPAAVGLMLSADDLVLSILGPEWADAGAIIRIIALVVAIKALSQIPVSLIVGMGKSTLRLKLNSVKLAIAIVLLIFWYRDGIVAVSWAFMLGHLVVVPLDLVVAKKLIRFSYLRLWQVIAPALFGALLMAVCVSFARNELLDCDVRLRCVSLVVIGACVYPLVLSIGELFFRGKLVTWRYFADNYFKTQHEY